MSRAKAHSWPSHSGSKEWTKKLVDTIQLQLPRKRPFGANDGIRETAIYGDGSNEVLKNLPNEIVHINTIIPDGLSYIEYDPIRVPAQNGMPKRFCRTFWRSLNLRMMKAHS